MKSNLKQIQKFVTSVFEDQTNKLSFYQEYNLIYKCIISCKKDTLYQYLRSIIIKQTIKGSLFIEEYSENKMIDTFYDHCQKQFNSLEIINQMFTLLNVSFIEIQKLPPLELVGKQLWKTYLFQNEKSKSLNILAKLCSKLIEAIQKDRNDQKIEYKKVSFLLRMLVSLSKEMYEKSFELPFLKVTEEYYDVICFELIQKSTVGEYFKKIQEIYQKEKKRLRRYIPNTTRKKLLDLLINVCITKHIHILKNSPTGLVTLFKRFQNDELQIIYKLLVSMGQKAWLLGIFRQILLEYGESLNLSLRKIKDIFQIYQLIRNCINIRFAFNGIIVFGLENDHEFHVVCDQCFHKFLNQTQKVARYLPLFIDFQIQNMENKDAEDIQSIFMRFSDILKFINDKDIFKKNYEFYLIRRIIRNRQNLKWEYKCIKSIKSKSWPALTLKMENILNNLDVSEYEKELYNKYQNEFKYGLNPIDLQPWVFKLSLWNNISMIKCNLPNFLQKNLKNFTNFYKDQHSSRKLTFQFDSGFAKINFYTKQNNKCIKNKLIAPTFQMLILLLFNQKFNGNSDININDNDNDKNNDNSLPPVFTIKEISDKINIPFEIVKLCISVLISKESPVLIRKSYVKENEINSEDKVTVNLNFNSNSNVTKIQEIYHQLIQKELKVKNKIDPHSRELLIQVTLMRIIKSQILMPEEELITEVKKKISYKFVPSVSKVEKNIRLLIKREYLKREDKSIRYLP
ncbi:cullin [Anaeramoeba flamelloides]|uniref:Cullin n=1 Tax=Anaeramoeba flamelloides TaxID=1746091 RepID=A0ABQ8Z703_9EUKA|nr:cullin [Anaeramoeba flamelloides]